MSDVGVHRSGLGRRVSRERHRRSSTRVLLAARGGRAVQEAAGGEAALPEARPRRRAQDPDRGPERHHRTRGPLPRAGATGPTGRGGRGSCPGPAVCPAIKGSTTSGPARYRTMPRRSPTSTSKPTSSSTSTRTGHRRARRDRDLALEGSRWSSSIPPVVPGRPRGRSPPRREGRAGAAPVQRVRLRREFGCSPVGWTRRRGRLAVRCCSSRCRSSTRRDRSASRRDGARGGEARTSRWWS